MRIKSCQGWREEEFRPREQMTQGTPGVDLSGNTKVSGSGAEHRREQRDESREVVKGFSFLFLPSLPTCYHSCYTMEFLAKNMPAGNLRERRTAHISCSLGPDIILWAMVPAFLVSILTLSSALKPPYYLTLSGFGVHFWFY